MTAAPEFYTIKDVCSTLRISRVTVYKLIDEGHLKRIYPRRRSPRITGESMAAFLRTCEAGPLAVEEMAAKFEAARTVAAPQAEQPKNKPGLLARWGINKKN